MIMTIVMIIIYDVVIRIYRLCFSNKISIKIKIRIGNKSVSITTSRSDR